MYEIIISGFGGQGVLASGVLLANAAMKNGKHVTWIPSYGAEIRGGTANCSIKVSDKNISSPFAYSLDVLIALNEPSLNKFLNSVKPNGLVILNSSIIPDKEIRKDVDVVRIPVTDKAREIGDVRTANIMILGALLKKLPVVTGEALLEAVREYFSRKGNRVIELNEKAFNEGYDFVNCGNDEACSKPAQNEEDF